MVWLESSGGPFIMMDEDQRKNWHGINTSVFPNYVSNYEAACDCDSYIGSLNYHDCSFVIFNDEPYRTSVVVQQDGFFVMRWRWSNDIEPINTLIKNDFNVEFTDDGVLFHTRTGRIFLFDSSYDGRDIFEKIDFSSKIEFYKISSAFYEPNVETSFLIHKFTLY